MMEASQYSLLLIVFTCNLFAWSQGGGLCEFSGRFISDCKITLNRNGKPLLFATEVTECSSPPEVIVNLALDDNRWKHVFINPDESHSLYTLPCCLSIRVRLNSSQNHLQIQASLYSNTAMQQYNVMDSVVEIPSSSRCVSGLGKESLPLILFVVFCALILLVLLGIIMCRKRLFPQKMAPPDVSVTSSSHRLIVDSDVPYISDVYDAENNVEDFNGSTTLVSNLIYRPHSISEEPMLPPIAEELDRFDSWAAYENVSVLEDEMTKLKGNKARRGKRKKHRSRMSGRAPPSFQGYFECQNSSGFGSLLPFNDA